MKSFFIKVAAGFLISSICAVSLMLLAGVDVDAARLNVLFGIVSFLIGERAYNDWKSGK